MQYVFEVKIHYTTGDHITVNGIAENDILAREEAIRNDTKVFIDNLVEDPPQVTYCETSMICCLAFSAHQAGVP